MGHGPFEYFYLALPIFTRRQRDSPDPTIPLDQFAATRAKAAQKAQSRDCRGLFDLYDLTSS
jgi:hypothetical protein